MTEKKTINKKSQRYVQRLDRTTAPLIKQPESHKHTPTSVSTNEPVKLVDIVPSGNYEIGIDYNLPASGFNKKKGKSYGI